MNDDDFIGLPPGILPPSVVDQDSGTVRYERAERPRADRDEIVFFPVGVAPAAPPAAPAEAPVTAAQADAALADAPEVDDATRVSVSRPTTPTWRLIVEGLEPVAVEGVLFLGRDPVVIPGHPAARVLAVQDKTKSVSKTHAMLEVEGGILWVYDLNSTNGVWVVPGGQDAHQVTRGQRVAVPPGANLELGDLVIQVEHL